MSSYETNEQKNNENKGIIENIDIMCNYKILSDLQEELKYYFITKNSEIDILFEKTNEYYNELKKPEVKQIENIPANAKFCKNGHILQWGIYENCQCSLCFRIVNSLKGGYKCNICVKSLCIKCFPPKMKNGFCPLNHNLEKKMFGLLDICEICEKRTGMTTWFDKICNLKLCKDCKQ